MIDFNAMNARQARDYLQSWVATTEARRERLEQALAAVGRGPLRVDVPSLLEVAQWLGSVARLREGVVLGGPMPDLSEVDPAQVPSWFDATAAGAWMFDDQSTWAIDAAALNFGHVVTTLDPQVTWVVDRQRPRYLHQNRPGLTRPGLIVPVHPISVHVDALVGLHYKGRPPEEAVRTRLAELGLS